MAEESAKPSSIPDQMTEEMKNKIENGKNKLNQIEDENQDPTEVLEEEEVPIYKHGDPRFKNKTLDEIVKERFYYKDKIDWTTRIIPTPEDDTD